MSDDRYILVVADNSEEMNTALEYACARSKKTGRKIIIATFIEPLDVLTTKGVTDIMKEEAREEAKMIWNLINSPNLKENIAPLKNLADVILFKAKDHSIWKLALKED